MNSSSRLASKDFQEDYVPAILASIKAANELDTKEAALVMHEKFDKTPVDGKNPP